MALMPRLRERPSGEPNHRQDSYTGGQPSEHDQMFSSAPCEGRIPSPANEKGIKLTCDVIPRLISYLDLEALGWGTNEAGPSVIHH